MTEKTQEKEILASISSPADLKGLSAQQLDRLAEELRGVIVDVVSRRGGHLASNLGVTDLTIALHRVFDLPHDRLLWDVGHQCYPHKLLTGRQTNFQKLRQSGGMSGFPDPQESQYDLFKVGHAGTAISTAMGMALADSTLRPDSRVVAVVGDASIVNGLSLEAINNAVLVKRQLLVILNDNSMAIDVTQGGLARVLDRVRLTKAYRDLVSATDNVISRLPMGKSIQTRLRHVREGLRAAVHGQQAFEALGFNYFGPVDGHNIAAMEKVFSTVAKIQGPVLVHVHTEKGRGYEYAVDDPTTFHSPSSWKIESGKAIFKGSDRASWTKTFADSLLDLARENEKIRAITAAMPDGTGLNFFRDKFPDRYYDVGISESHALAMAAGMAKSGLRPVVAIYSTFMQRAIDQVFQECSLQGLPVVVCMDRAGLVGSDGAVHHGFMDIAALRPMPGVTLAAPADADEMKACLKMATESDGPVAIRYPRDIVPDNLPGECPPFEPGKARVISTGTDGAFFCYGSTVDYGRSAAAELRETSVLDFGVVNARFAKPVDIDCVIDILSRGGVVIVCEEHVRAGGLYEAVLSGVAAANIGQTGVAGGAGGAGGAGVAGVAGVVDIRRIFSVCLPDRFIHQASRVEQLSETGLDTAGLVAMAHAAVESAAIAKDK